MTRRSADEASRRRHAAGGPVDEPPTGGSRRGWLGVVYEWLARASPFPSPAADESRRDPAGAAIPKRVGHYVIRRELGKGGMGVVYEARDERLHRPVAVKMMSSPAIDDTARKRFWREARAAASVSHPNVCQIYEIGEDGGDLFIAMELLAGETLVARLERGPAGVGEARRVGLEMLAALSALHARGIIHRDLKPSNVFLTPHGVKLLDFGVARPAMEAALGPDAGLTPTGMVIGTPRYLAPELATGDGADPRSDLFSLGAILFEMLANRPAFSGGSILAVLHATLHEQPPALTGSPAVAAVDRVIRRALAKRPADRPASADAMAAELQAIGDADGDRTPVLARTLTRLVVLPFRVLRADPESDFLAFSLADAITTSLSGFQSLLVRSSAVAARFAGESPDLKALAAEADVDRAVLGTLLRSGDQVRAVAQLIDVPGGTLLASHTIQVSVGDLFRLQDDLASRVVESLALPLTGAAAASDRDTPHDPRAYESYLRGNQVAQTYDGLPRARDLYRECVELDPSFAPAWARLGRCYRVIAKYIDGRDDGDTKSREALDRALELNPRLSLAHRFLANLEADTGQATRAVERLVTQANRYGNDPELFAGLVHACRYGGLFDESIAAHAEARRLDPNVPSSVEQTMLMAGELDRLLAIEQPLVVAGADDRIRIIALGLAGRRDEARDALAAMRRPSYVPAFQAWTAYLLAWLERRVPDMLTHMEAIGPLKIRDDPESIFQEGWFLCDAGDPEAALPFLRRAVEIGYFPVETLVRGTPFDPIRRHPTFQEVLRAARAGQEAARHAFERAGGARLLRG